MSKFYSEIANYYDDIFPMSQVTLDLIEACVGNAPKDILDVACGSGLYSQALHDAGYRVTAIDLDENMIGRLQQRNAAIKAKVLNMLEIETLAQKFDMIFSIGNSLVHLKDNQEIRDFLNSSYRCLKPQGQLLIQVVNYDRILEKDIKNLSTIENKEKGLRFERNYEYLKEQHKINFNAVLHVNGERLENSVLLHPIRSKELVKLFEDVGFSDIELFGSLKKEIFDPLESIALVAIGSKRS